MTDQKPAGRRRTPKNPRARRRERIAAAIEALAKVVDRFLEEVSLPSPKKFEAIREGRAPWTAEAYLAATARNLHFFLDMVFTLTRDSSPELSALLEDLERRGWTAKAPLERSLRYLVAKRSGQAIEPSEAEIRDQRSLRRSSDSLVLKDVHPAAHFHAGTENPDLDDLSGWALFELEGMIERTLRRVLQKKR